MKKVVFFLIAISIVAFSACNKKDTTTSCALPTTKAPAAEVAALQQYLTTNSIAATADSLGFFYMITAPGTGAHPDLCSNLTVNYKLYITTSNSLIEKGDAISFPLNGLIVGWQEGIPLIATGGSITLYLPPSLAYGATATSKVPANSMLIFKIDLLAIK